MMKLTELPAPITHWAHDRSLVVFAFASQQRLKLIEESGELANAILKNNIAEQKDAIGDMFVVLVILAAQMDYNLQLETLPNYFDGDVSKDADVLIKEIIQSAVLGHITAAIARLGYLAKGLDHDLTECANLAYNVIKNRKGKTVNGTFLKN